MTELWPYVLAIFNAAVVLTASMHAILNKRDAASAIAWVGLIWLAPLLGAVTYYLLGINRIRRRGQALREPGSPESRLFEAAEGITPALPEIGVGHAGLAPLVRLVGELTGRPLTAGNTLSPLVNGEEAYPAMLEAIGQAEHSIALCTYIFDNDQVGAEFLAALAGAAHRGVAVCVLIDDIGARYTRPSIVGRLQAARVPVRSFLPTRVPRLFHYANLRIHRKILVVDGTVGFTGGMNIREGHRLYPPTRHPIQDLHFRVTGPVIAQMLEVFSTDWTFCAGEPLRGERWRTRIVGDGAVWARGIADGPDEDFEKLQLTILGALASARHSIRVATPYFLPDTAVTTALNVAAMRGVEVDIVLPARNNIALVQWASAALFGELLARGCRIWLTPAPFDHTKVTVIDDAWSLVGSTNWDPRSLRLNFEFNLECYDEAVARHLSALVRHKIRASHRVTLDDWESKSLAVKLRDGTARLLSPYL